MISNAQNFIRINQVGYTTTMKKYAFVVDEHASTFSLHDIHSDSIVFQGRLGDSKYCSLSEENVKCADFSIFQTEGTFYIECNGNKSYPFVIQKDNIYRNVSKASIRAFYYWRASTELLPQYATWNGIDFSRALGHADTEVKIHKSAVTKVRLEGTIVSAPKGWYDAGDYNLYVVNAGISFHSLACAYEMFPEYYKQLHLNIPESGNDVPDILNEMKWELDWLFAMQDEDGGVYTKLSSLHFCSMIMPHEDNLERYMIGKSTASALDFAAMMAMASRIYKAYEKQFPGLSEKALVAAKRAWNWAKKNPTIYYENPIGVTTGNYKDYDVRDEFFWAASELFITTKDQAYYKELDFNLDFPIPEWGTVSTLGLMSLLLHDDVLEDSSVVVERFSSIVQKIYGDFEQSNHGIPIDHFNWGSNGVIATAGVLLGLADKKIKDSRYNYCDAMFQSWHYLLGCNPTGYCFVSGFGSQYPRHLHDRRCTADGIKEPIPGYLVGGATNIILRDCGGNTYPSKAPAACYLDKICSFSTNEIAINWNAPFVFLAGMVENSL